MVTIDQAQNHSAALNSSQKMTQKLTFGTLCCDNEQERAPLVIWASTQCLIIVRLVTITYFLQLFVKRGSLIKINSCNGIC